MRRIILAATIALTSCLSGPLDTATEEQTESVTPETVCDFAFCTFDWQCDSECSGPAKCSPRKCDNCGGQCVGLTAPR